MEEKLDKFIKNTVDKDKNIFNALLAVSAGDEKFSWSCAAGISNKERMIATTPSTPFFIASITKLFTATTIMKLYEEKKLNLEDKIVNYLDDKLVKLFLLWIYFDHSNA